MPLERHYHQILQCSQQMLVAAEAENWERLIALEAERSSLLNNTPATKQGDDTVAIACVVQEIQAIDAKIHEIVATWLEHAKILLRIKPISPP